MLRHGKVRSNIIVLVLNTRWGMVNLSIKRTNIYFVLFLLFKNSYSKSRKWKVSCAIKIRILTLNGWRRNAMRSPRVHKIERTEDSKAVRWKSVELPQPPESKLCQIWKTTSAIKNFWRRIQYLVLLSMKHFAWSTRLTWPPVCEASIAPSLVLFLSALRDDHFITIYKI